MPTSIKLLSSEYDSEQNVYKVLTEVDGAKHLRVIHGDAFFGWQEHFKLTNPEDVLDLILYEPYTGGELTLDAARRAKAKLTPTGGPVRDRLIKQVTEGVDRVRKVQQVHRPPVHGPGNGSELPGTDQRQRDQSEGGAVRPRRLLAGIRRRIGSGE